MCPVRMRGSGHQLQHRRFCLNSRKHFFTVRVAEKKYRFPGEFVKPPSFLEIFKSYLDRVIGNWF